MKHNRNDYYKEFFDKLNKNKESKTMCKLLNEEDDIVDSFGDTVDQNNSFEQEPLPAPQQEYVTKTLYKVKLNSNQLMFVVGSSFSNVYDTIEASDTINKNIIISVEDHGSVIMLDYIKHEKGTLIDVSYNSYCINNSIYILSKSITEIEKFCDKNGIIIVSITSLRYYLENKANTNFNDCECEGC